MRDKREFFRFDHPKDIMIGKGRIVYEPSYETWILPGGIRTRDHQRDHDSAGGIQAEGGA
jgi:hypothetical protein